MDYADYAELRRRAEKRLTIISVWPFLLVQAVAYLLMFARSDPDLGIPMFAGVAAAGTAIATTLIYRRRTAANRAVRRAAIDETLEDAVSIGWPIEDPTPRELRLLAALLDDDLETRAGIGKVMVWATVLGALFWFPTFFMAFNGTGIIPFQGTGFEFFLLWLIALGAFRHFHQRTRHVADGRVRAALERATVWSGDKAKRAEAPWWNDDEEFEKPKRNDSDIPPPAIADDGEFDDGLEGLPRRHLRSG